MFNVIETALADHKKEMEDIIRGLQLDLAQVRQSLAVSDMPLEVMNVPPTSSYQSLANTTCVDRILKTAEDEWRKRVTEPIAPGDENAKIIDNYIRGPQGLGWGTVDYHTWKPNVPYMKNLDFAWCGAFAAFCYGSAGLLAGVRHEYFAGTDRLYRWARGTPRFIADWQDIQPGDIVVLGGENRPAGQHITLAGRLLVQEGILCTFEGNATGDGVQLAGKSCRYEGVVTNSRLMNAPRAKPTDYRFAFAVRPMVSDYRTTP